PPAVPSRLERVFLQELLRLDQQRPLVFARGKDRGAEPAVADFLPARGLDHAVVVFVRDLPKLARLLAAVCAHGFRVARRNSREQKARVAAARAPRDVLALDEDGVDAAIREVPQ